MVDRFFAISATTIFLVTGYLGTEAIKFQAEVRDDPKFSTVQLGFPEPIDLAGGFAAACAIGLFRYFAFHCFRPIGTVILSEKKRVDKDRLDRFAVCCFKFCYFVFITAIGWVIMKDEDWFPPVLGGSGATVNCYKGFPFHEVSQTIRYYYMTQLGYHMHSLLFLVFFSTPRNDYTEMFIHHCCAITAVAVSWQFNYWKIGCLVLIVHDVGDVVGYLIKAVVDTDRFVMVISVYLVLLGVWGYSRLYAFPFFILYSSTFESTGAQPPPSYTPTLNPPFPLLNTHRLPPPPPFHPYSPTHLLTYSPTSTLPPAPAPRFSSSFFGRHPHSARTTACAHTQWDLSTAVDATAAAHLLVWPVPTDGQGIMSAV
jgi:hypothetical protein